MSIPGMFAFVDEGVKWRCEDNEDHASWQGGRGAQLEELAASFTPLCQDVPSLVVYLPLSCSVVAVVPHMWHMCKARMSM